MPIQTITLSAAEKVFIPKTAKILSVDSIGGITISSSCIETVALPKKCYSISWAITENSGGETQAWEDSDPNNKVNKIFTANILNTVDIDFNDHAAILDKLVLLGGGSIIPISSSQTTSISDIDTISIIFKAPESIGNNTWIGFSITHSSDADIRIYAKEIDCPDLIV